MEKQYALNSFNALWIFAFVCDILCKNEQRVCKQYLIFQWSPIWGQTKMYVVSLFSFATFTDKQVLSVQGNV